MSVISNTERPGFFCSDEEVQAFCTLQAWNFNTYGPEPPLSGPKLFEAARRRFGDMRCWDLEFWMN